MLSFHFLGTSSGIPTRIRNVSGFALRRQQDKGWVLVDCGEGTQHQLLHVPYSLVHLEAIFITHVHGDHCYGLPGLLATASMAGRDASLTIVAPLGIEEYVRTTIACTDMRLTYPLNFIACEEYSLPGCLAGFEVSAIPLSHRVPCVAYRFEMSSDRRSLDAEKLALKGVARGPQWGALARGEHVILENGETLLPDDYLLPHKPPRSIIVGGDNDTPACLREAIVNTDVLVHEATYTQAISDKVGPGPQHCSAKQIAEFAEHVALPSLVLTHFSARYHHPKESKHDNISELEAEARQYYSGNLFLANDLDCFFMDSDGRLTRQEGR